MSDHHREIGTLVVVVLKAQHLRQPSFYKQNPYAQAALSGLMKRTKVDQKGGQHPVWDEEFRFPVLADVGKDKANRILEVACYKDEQRGDDILLGKGTVDIEETLKTGEFDDWVSLETSAGARGEIYLEMTFYANSPPPVTRRPSKLNPSDRVARPAAHFNQSQQLIPKSTSPNASPQPGRTPITGERKLVQQSQTGGTQLPASLLPAHGPQSQPSKQASPSGGTSVATVKQRNDPLPPLPPDDTLSDVQVGSGKKSGLPAALQPGGGGPRPMPPHSRNRVVSTSHLPPEEPPGQPPRSLSDTPRVITAVPSSSLPLQSSVQYSTPGTASMTSPAPSIVVKSTEENPHVAFPVPFPLPPGSTQEYESRGVYAAANYDAFSYGFPAYTAPNLHPYTSATNQAYALSSSQHLAPAHPSHVLPGQPQQHFDSGPTSPYTQYPNGLSPPFSPSPAGPQLHSATPQPQQQPQSQYTLQQPPYSPQLQQYLPHQQLYSPSPQQQYLTSSQQHLHHPQQVSYTQVSHHPQVPQPYQQYDHPGAPPSNPVPVSQQQMSQYTQTSQQFQQQHFTISAPSQAVQSRTLQSQQPQRPKPHFSIPPPPPPPPPLQYIQVDKGHSTSNPIAQSLPTPTLPSMSSPVPISPATPFLQNVDLVVPSPQPPTAALSSQVVLSTTPDTGTEVVRRGQEGQNDVQPVLVARGIQSDLTKIQIAAKKDEQITGEKQRQVDEVKDIGKQGAHEGSHCGQQMEEEVQRRREEGLERKDEGRLEEVECRRLEEAEQRKQEGEEGKTEEEKRRLEEEILKSKEEQIRRDEEERRRQEELRNREEERKHMEEIERRKSEEEGRRRREEEHRRKEEERIQQEAHRRWEEEERTRREEERQRKEEERVRQEREETERRRRATEEEARRKHAEEAEAERRWQEELARIRARTEQEAADAAFARAQMEAEAEERRRQEEADFALVLEAQDEAEREERLTQDRRRQEEADMEVARREQAHEEELERRRQEEKRKRMEEADRELARKLDMELNLGTQSSPNSGSRRGSRAERNRRY